MILRLGRSRLAIPVRSADLGSLLFGQLAVEHQDLLGTGSRTHNRIELRDLPHYRFWRDGEDRDPGGGTYDKFLACSESDPARRADFIAEYIRLRDDVRSRGVKEPLRIVVAPDGRRVLLDGSKRAAIAYALGQDVPFTEVGLDEVLRSIVANPHEKYGTGPVGRPYQSIFFKEAELVAGRRTDVLERFRKMRIEDVRGRRVLDIGCNIAVNAMTAWHFGAASVTGMEYSPQIAAAALRLSVILDARLKVQVQDLGQPIPGSAQFDTVLCFSLYQHVGDKAALEDNIARVTGQTLYFEGHENAKREDYEHIFRHFQQIEHLGFNRDGIHNRASTRPFFRCVRT
jgi:hypothetical protein